ncbi:GGDEF domain-containing protein [Alteromonas gracilis]|uniref:GGDEF domain-containing protein n=1 Tax=Alteromonas gracilis TaxID=1479524 RepID=UPI0030D477F3
MLIGLKKALKKDKASCVALIDIDHFKRINDSYGHLVGDEVLATLSNTIKSRIRKSDKLCRYGSEEFLIYFTDSNEQEVKRVLDALNKTISNKTVWKHTDERFAVSFSSGVLKVEGETNLDIVIRHCDALLDAAKQRGSAHIGTYSMSMS